DHRTIDIQSSIVPSEVFGHATDGIEHELSELIIDISLAADYTGDDAIIYAGGLAARANALQSYLFAHFDELVNQKKMREYAKKAN
uniref:hypothetical protein n=1 Tax=Chamaesiphon sp. OTE_8_metabat_110 TaxID=2964696 RepID=UPI00286B3F1D